MVSSDVDIRYLSLAFKDLPVLLHKVGLEIGTVQLNALEIDKANTKESVKINV